MGDEYYDKAYEVLSEDFKNTYFPTFEAFEKYAKEKYPIMENIKYNEIQRQGDYYIVKVTIEDFMEKKDTFTQTFILLEHDFNDYEIAFSV